MWTRAITRGSTLSGRPLVHGTDGAPVGGRPQRPHTAAGAADLRQTPSVHRHARPYDHDGFSLSRKPSWGEGTLNLWNPPRTTAPPRQCACGTLTSPTGTTAAATPASTDDQGSSTMELRVERDALADAVVWTARSLPARPPMQVLLGLLLEVGQTDGLSVSGLRLRGLLADQRGRHRQGAGSGAGPGPAAVRHRPLAAGPAGRPAAGGQPGGADLRRCPVHAPDPAGRGLPRAAGDADRGRLARERRVRGRGRPGRAGGRSG